MVHRQVVSRGFKIHYVDEGSGPGLVLIPGILMSAARWVDTGYVGEFSPDFRVLAMDPLGHGLSDKPDDPAVYGMEEIVRDVLAVMDDAGVERAHLWGYSRGGGIAAAVATIAPEHVLSLVCGGARLDPARGRGSGRPCSSSASAPQRGTPARMSSGPSGGPSWT